MTKAPEVLQYAEAYVAAKKRSQLSPPPTPLPVTASSKLEYLLLVVAPESAS